MSQFDKAFVEYVLNTLDKNSCLFPQFALTKRNDELKLLGTGGFSVVYEMYNKQRPEQTFAIKVIGFQRHTVGTEEFWNTERIQSILCQESGYIMRVLDARDLQVFLDQADRIINVRDVEKVATDDITNAEARDMENYGWKENQKCLHLQFVLMEKLDEIIQKDRFNKVSLLKNEMHTETEVLKFAIEIGQALALCHNNRWLHRDVKLENIFWDAQEKVYKLGDFGIAKEVENGNAQTMVYTDGYGAPEIESRLYDGYNATADIYSFGITLYLLLNDLKFPGSDGYYPKVEVQYNPDYVFPAPIHGSEMMTRIIRKMTCYYAEERYQSVNEVLCDLAMVLDADEVNVLDDLLELEDLATETFREEPTYDEAELSGKGVQSKEEQKLMQKIADSMYREDSVKYYIAITLLVTLQFKAMQTDVSMITNWMFWTLPIAVLFEALLQCFKEFHLMVGTIVLVFAGISVYSLGLTVPHIILIACVLNGSPLFSMVGATSTGLWIALELSGKLQFLDILQKWDVGWIFLVSAIAVLNQYFQTKVRYEKTTEIRKMLGVIVYTAFFCALIGAGIILWLLQLIHVAVIPEIIERIHFVRTGLVGFLVAARFFRDDYGEELAKDDECLDERGYGSHTVTTE